MNALLPPSALLQATTTPQVAEPDRQKRNMIHRVPDPASQTEDTRMGLELGHSLIPARAHVSTEGHTVLPIAWISPVHVNQIPLYLHMLKH